MMDHTAERIRVLGNVIVNTHEDFVMEGILFEGPIGTDDDVECVVRGLKLTKHVIGVFCFMRKLPNTKSKQAKEL